MEVIKINNHPISANTYIAFDEDTKDGVIIDPSFYIENAIKEVINEGINIRAILLTHGHFDHISGVEQVRRMIDVPVYIHEKDADMLTSSDRNQGSSFGIDIVSGPADNIFSDNDTLSFGSISFKVLHTPGHTEGSVCFLSDDVMFTGDTLFHMSIGRTDMEGGNYSDILVSLSKLAQIDVDYKVYPGHEQSTSLFYEKDNNPFLNI